MPLKITHKAWVEVIKMIAVKEFVISKKNNPTQNYAAHLKEFENTFEKITRDSLGVYRPEEHIDNPKGLEDESILADKKLKDRIYFRYEHDKNRFSETTLYPGPYIKKLMNQTTVTSYDVNPDTKMKRFIKEDFPDRPSSFTFFKQQLYLAVEYGNSPKGYMHLGAAFHVLEDYYAHSNFVEISLIKVGYLNTEPWIQPVPEITSTTTGPELACQIPIVTGVFGLQDLVASVVPKFEEIILPTNVKEFKDLEPKERTLFDNLVVVVLEDFINQNKGAVVNPNNDTIFFHGFDLVTALAFYKDYLVIRDQYLVLRKAIAFLLVPIEKIEEMISKMIDVILYYPKALVALLAACTNEVIKLIQSTNTYYGTDPTHTQIAKDDAENSLNPLAGLLAAAAVGEIGSQIKECWKKKKKVKEVVHWADTRYFVHPCDTDWMEERVIEWAKKNPDKIENVKSSHKLEEVIKYLDEMLKFDLNSLDFKNIIEYEATILSIFSKTNTYRCFYSVRFFVFGAISNATFM